MVYIDAFGEQKLECRDLAKILVRLAEQYPTEIFIGSIVQMAASFYLAKQIPKEEYLKTCAEIFELSKKHYEEYSKEHSDDARK